MDKKILSTTEAPAAIGPYSQGWRVGGLVLTSGQIPVEPATGEIPEASRRRSSRAAKTSRQCSGPAAQRWKTL